MKLAWALLLLISPICLATDATNGGISGNTAVEPTSPTGERPMAAQRMAVLFSADGSVTDIRYRSDAPAALKEVVTRAVRKLRFTPHLEAGQAVPWAVMLTLKLSAVPINDKGQFGLKVTGSVLTSTAGESLSPPLQAYHPFGALPQESAVVCVQYAVDADGRVTVTDAFRMDTDRYGHRDPFVVAARKAFKAWSVKMLEVDGSHYGVAFQSHSMIKSTAGPSPSPGLATPPASPAVDFGLCRDRAPADAGATRLVVDPVGSML